MRRSIVLSLVVLAVLVPVVSPALATGGEPQPAQQEASQNFTLEELRSDGTHYGKPSARIADQQIWWVVHWPADQPWSDPGEDQQWEYLKPGTTVQRNSIHLRTIRTEETPETKTVNIVYWTKGTKVVERGNTTTTEPVPRNVTHVTKQVQFGKGWPSKEIQLRQHDNTVRVTMWIGDAPSEARWTFKHKSIATTASANIESQGEYLLRAGTQFVLPTIVGLFLVGMVVKRAIDKAGRGPGYGYGPWIVGLGLIGGGTMLAMYSNIAGLLVDLPWILAALTVSIAGIVILETHTADAGKAWFFRPEIDTGTSPTGEHAIDIQNADVVEKTLVKRDGETILAPSGLSAFLARWAGGATVLEGAKQLKTEIHLSGVDVDEIYVISPTADEVLHHEPEGWQLDYPSPDEDGWSDTLVTTLAFAGGVGAVAMAAGPLVAIGAGAVFGAWKFVEPADGEARIDPAPAHVRSAWASMLFLAEEVDAAETIEAERNARIEAEVSSEKEKAQALAEQDATLVESMHETDVARAIETQNGRTGQQPDPDERTDEEVPADD